MDKPCFLSVGAGDLSRSCPREDHVNAWSAWPNETATESRLAIIRERLSACDGCTRQATKGDFPAAPASTHTPIPKPATADPEALLSFVRRCLDCASFACRKVTPEAVPALSEPVSDRIAYSSALYRLGVAEPKCKLKGGCSDNYEKMAMAGRCKKEAP